MVYDFVVTVKRPDTRIADVISHILYFIALVSLSFCAVTALVKQTALGSMALAALIVISWISIIVRKSKGGKVYFTTGLVLASIGWFYFDGYRNIWLGLLYIVAALAEREFKFPKEIGFTVDEIVFNSLFKKRYYWDEVSNAMIKDDILTLDFNNNKVVQKEIQDGVSKETELEFNAFCKERLRKVPGAEIV